jgi:hypothetical protein
MVDRIRRIHQMVEAPAPRWMFKAGMREAFTILQCEADEWKMWYCRLEIRTAWVASLIK